MNEGGVRGLRVFRRVQRICLLRIVVFFVLVCLYDISHITYVASCALFSSAHEGQRVCSSKSALNRKESFSVFIGTIKGRGCGGLVVSVPSPKSEGRGIDPWLCFPCLAEVFLDSPIFLSKV